VFVEAVAATYVGTRDSWLTRKILDRGLLGAARSDFRDYQQMEYLPKWWELAYADDGELAGVILRRSHSPVRGIVVAWTSPRRRSTPLVVVSSLDLERELSRGGNGSRQPLLSWRSAGSWSSVTLSGVATRRWLFDVGAPTAARLSSS
jgi:hypothetical protein